MEHTIQITSSHNYLALISRNRYHQIGSLERLIIDLRGSNLFMEPHHVVLLACLIEEFHQNGSQIAFQTSRYGKLIQYLHNIRFFEYWKPNFNRDNFTKTRISTTLCLWHISQEMISTYANQAKSYFEQNYFEGKDLFSLHIALSEVFNNIFDHAESQINGYVLTQYYPNMNKIVIAVCDFGLGIPTKINAYLVESDHQPLEDNQALRMAFRKGVTSKTQPNNMGYGLDNLCSQVKSLRGEMFFVSNKGRVAQRANGKTDTYLYQNDFSGTLISIKLDTRVLPEMNYEETIIF